MDTSTNALGANPAGQRELVECTKLDVGQYPNTYGDNLREELARLYRLKADNFVVGNGSDEALDIIMKTFVNRARRSSPPTPAYVLHSFFVKINADARSPWTWTTTSSWTWTRSTPPRESWSCCARRTIRRPHLPPGRSEGGHRGVRPAGCGGRGVRRVHRISFLPLVNRYDNLIVTRTFSKAYGLAGMRIGYMAAGAEMAEAMQKVKIPYSLNMIGERVAIAALRDREFLERSVRTVNQERPFLMKGLSDLGFRVFPSEANYILFRTDLPSDVITSKLAEKGVLVRASGRCAGWRTASGPPLAPGDEHRPAG